ncbi:unnamed protein product [Rotaria sp. Silwood2]|nr:unnamed protein product [Rotaria sp. Silwood2]
MSSKTATKEKTSNGREKKVSDEAIEEMVLMRDEASQALVIVSTRKVSSIKKVSKLVPGTIVTMQDASRERWRGPILDIGKFYYCLNDSIMTNFFLGTEAQCAKTMTTIEKNLGISGKDTSMSKSKGGGKLQSTITVEGKDPEEVQSNHDEDDDSGLLYIHDQEEEDENKQEEGEIDTQEKENNSSWLQATTISSISKSSRGEKRPCDENINDSKKKKNSNKSLTVSYSMYSEKEQQCLVLQSQVTMYQQEWMRKYKTRPKDPKVIKYLIDITDILRGKVDENDEEPGEILLKIMEDFDVSEKDLLMCHRKTATRTARQIMKLLYPNPSPNLKLNNIDEYVIISIIKYTKLSNPNDKVNEADIRHAIGNYIAVHAFKQKQLKNASSKIVTKDTNKNNHFDSNNS